MVKCELSRVICAQPQLKTKTLALKRELETIGILQHSDLASGTGRQAAKGELRSHGGHKRSGAKGKQLLKSHISIAERESNCYQNENTNVLLPLGHHQALLDGNIMWLVWAIEETSRNQSEHK